MIFDGTRAKLADFIYPENRIERRRLERMVNIDVLTGLGNRRAFDLALPAAEADPQTAVILFDANDFGKINKTAGHDAGDGVIREMAEAILSVARRFRVAERCFRLGGDEFVIICPLALAPAIRDRIERGSAGKFFGIDISLSGTIGSTLAAADASIQARKQKRKAATI